MMTKAEIETERISLETRKNELTHLDLPDYSAAAMDAVYEIHRILDRLAELKTLTPADNEREGHDTPLAADSQQMPYWERVACEPEDSEPVSFSNRVQFAAPSLVVIAAGIEERRKLEDEVARLRAAIEAMVQAAYDDPYAGFDLGAKIIDIGREALAE